MEDLEAVSRTLGGDIQAFSIIVQRYTPMLYGLARRMSDSRDPVLEAQEAEEAVQEIFLRTYRALGSFNMKNRFYTWLYTIALNYLRSVRRKRRLTSIFASLPYNDELQAPDEVLSGPVYPGPEETSVNREGERLAGEALKKLKARQREVFVLRMLENRSVDETAKILGIPEGTVKIRLHRAKKELAAIMKSWQWEEGE
jgi:RNA polymerase sigma factor (sigma-70 family)